MLAQREEMWWGRGEMLHTRAGRVVELWPTVVEERALIRPRWLLKSIGTAR
jgi:hypothetical protein